MKGETLAKSPGVFIPRCQIQRYPRRKLTWQGEKKHHLKMNFLLEMVIFLFVMLVFGGDMKKFFHHGVFLFLPWCKNMSSKINMAASKVHAVKLVMSTALGEPENIKVSSRLKASWMLPPKKNQGWWNPYDFSRLCCVGWYLWWLKILTSCLGNS